MSKLQQNTSDGKTQDRVEDWYEKVYFVLSILGVRIPNVPWWVPDPDFRRHGFLMPIALTALAFAALLAAHWVLGLK
jgi:hypothetical protein